MKHYVYQITNLINGKTYIGVRSHPDPENDDYMSSSLIIKSLIGIHGLENFEKKILEEFNTREEASDYEKSFFTNDYLLDSENYNRGYGGGIPINMRKDIFYDFCEEIREEYLTGCTQGHLAKKYNCDKGTIARIIDDIKRPLSEVQKLRFESGIHPTRVDIPNDILDIIIQEYQKGMSINHLSYLYGYTNGVISHNLKRNRICIRKSNKHRPKNKVFNGVQFRNKYVLENAENIIRDYTYGISIPELSKKYKCDPGTMQRFIKLIIHEN